jgi:endonuclease III-like uncharacterized protein
MDYRERREYLLNKEKVCSLDKEELYELTFGSDIFYKNKYVSLVLKEEGKTDDTYFANLLDSNGQYITYVSKEYLDETIDDLKECQTDRDIVDYLIESGIVDYWFKEIDFNVKNDLLYGYSDEKINNLTQEQLNELVYNNDYVNKIGNHYIRCV